jgi:hypothetical protein
MKKQIFRAVCLRDTVQDNPYMYYKAGVEYLISSNSPVLKHFQPLEPLDDEEKAAPPKVEKGEKK